MARFRQPGTAAMAFMNTLVPTEARFSARARSARRPCSASAMPRQAKTRAAASGMAASRAAMTGRWRVASAIRYWAVKLTAAAAAARTPSPAAALRSHKAERSGPGPGHPGRGLAGLPVPRISGTGGPAGLVSASGMRNVTGWPSGLWVIQVRDVRRMIAVMA